MERSAPTRERGAHRTQKKLASSAGRSGEEKEVLTLNRSLLAHPNARSRAAEVSRRWQQRRAELLREACNAVAELTAAGEKSGPAIKRVARKFRARSLGHGLQLSLSAKSLERIYYQFRKKGESVFALRYVAGRKRDIDPLLLNLIVHGAIRQSKTVSELLTDAAAGARKGRASLTTLYRALPAKAINEFLLSERRLLALRQSFEQKLVAIDAQLCNLRADAERKFLTKGEA